MERQQDDIAQQHHIIHASETTTSPLSEVRCCTAVYSCSLLLYQVPNTRSNCTTLCVLLVLVRNCCPLPGINTGPAVRVHLHYLWRTTPVVYDMYSDCALLWHCFSCCCGLFFSVLLLTNNYNSCCTYSYSYSKDQMPGDMSKATNARRALPRVSGRVFHSKKE